jgi:hypothetical protein
MNQPSSSFAAPCSRGPLPHKYAEYYVAGGNFPVGQNSLCLDSPYYLLAKHGILAVCIAPHRYLSGPAISPRTCIHPALRPNGSSPTCIGDGAFRSFHLCASWRTSLFFSLGMRTVGFMAAMPATVSAVEEVQQRAEAHNQGGHVSYAFMKPGQVRLKKSRVSCVEQSSDPRWSE